MRLYKSYVYTLNDTSSQLTEEIEMRENLETNRSLVSFKETLP